MTISLVGGMISAAGTNVVTINPGAVGHAFVAYVRINDGTNSVSGISGGNCTWSRVAGGDVDSYGAPNEHEMWLGIATATGSSVATVSVTGGTIHDIDVQELSSSIGTTTVWSRDGSQQGFLNNASSGTVTFPTLTASATAAYIGHAGDPGGGNYSAPTSGYTLTRDSSGTPFIANAGVSGTVSPVCATDFASTSYAIAVLIVDAAPGGGTTSAPAGLAGGSGLVPGATTTAGQGTGAGGFQVSGFQFGAFQTDAVLNALQGPGAVGIRFVIGAAGNVPVTSRWDELQGLDIAGVVVPATNAHPGVATGVGTSWGVTSNSVRKAPAGLATGVGRALQTIMARGYAGLATGTGAALAPASAGAPPFLGPPPTGVSRALVVPALSGSLGPPGSYPAPAYEKLDLATQFWGPDSFVMTIGGAAAGADSLVKEALLWLPDEDDAVYLIESVQTDKTGASRANSTLTVSGRSVDGFAAYERVIIPPAGLDYDHVVNTSAETAMKHYVRSHASTGAPLPRQIPNLVVAPDLARGAEVDPAARYQKLGDVLLQLGLLGPLGWQTTIDPVSGTIIWDVLVPTDRSASVFLDFAFETVSAWQDTDSILNSATLAIVAGQGDLAARDVEVRYQGSEPAGYDRREVFIDARDVAPGDLATLDARGDAFLAANAETRSTVATIYPNGSFQPGRDFFLGDLVLLHDVPAGVNVINRVVKIVKTYDVSAAAPTINVSVGKPFPDVAPLVAAPPGGALDTVITSIGDITGQIGLAIGGLSIGGANLVHNSSFENAIAGTWDVGANWDAPYTSGGIFGTASARVQLLNQVAADLATTSFISVNPTDDYWVSFYSYLSGYTSGTARASVREYDAASNLLATTNIDLTAVELDPAGTRHALHFGIDNTTPNRVAWQATTASIKVAFLTPSSSTLTWQVDGVQVERGKIITAYAPAPQELIDGQVGTTQIADGSISTPKVIARSITSGLIAAGNITADLLAAQLVLGSTIIAGTPGAARVQLDGTKGFAAYDASGNQKVNIPTDGKPSTFAGAIIASTLEATGLAAFDGYISNNKASVETLQAGVQAPGSAPVLASGWPTKATLASPAASVSPALIEWYSNGYYDAAGGASGATPCYVAVISVAFPNNFYVVEWKLSDGTVDRVTLLGTLTAGADQINGITRIGASWYLTGIDAVPTNSYIWRVARSTGAQSAALSLGAWASHYPVDIKTDATSLFVLDNAQTVRTYTTAPALSATKALTGVALTSAIAFEHDGTNWWVVGTTASLLRVYEFTPATGAVVANADFPAPSSANLNDYGLYWDGSNFYSAIYPNALTQPTIYTHTSWDWTTASNVYWVASAWYDDAGTAHETSISPRASIGMDRRMQMAVTTTGIPTGGADDPDKVRIYMAPGAADPGAGNLNLQVTDALTNRLLTTYSFGAADGAGTVFPGGRGALLMSAAITQGFTLQGNGAINYTGTTFPVSPSTNDHFYRSDWQMEFYYDGSHWLTVQLLQVDMQPGQATNPGWAGISSSTSTSLRGVLPMYGYAASDIYLVDYVVNFYVNGGTALGASHKWVGTLNKKTAADASTGLSTATISSGSSSVWRELIVSINGLLDRASYLGMFSTDWVKTGTPGTLVWGERVTYRIVAT